MDSHQSFAFNWGDHGPSYNQQSHGLLGGPSQLASSSSTFEASYQNPFQAGMANHLPPNNDISMDGIEAEEQPTPSVPTAHPKTGSSRRAKAKHLDWNAYKDAIRSLYIDQNKSLPETMQAMDDLYSFKAS